MPVHDWSKATAGTFHDFHEAWRWQSAHPRSAIHLRPKRTLYRSRSSLTHRTLTRSASEEETYGPRLRIGLVSIPVGSGIYAAKANRIAIYHTSGDRVVAFIEIVSPGNRRRQVSVSQRVIEEQD